MAEMDLGHSQMRTSPQTESEVSGRDAMKSVQTMLSRARATSLSTAFFAAALALVAGCQPREPALFAPNQLVAPYASSANAPLPLWAVAPFNNESGTTTVDQLAVSDAIVAKASEVRGLATIPLNRTLAAMRSLRMDAVRSPSDARRLAQAVGADAIIIGSITAYDPYNPPKVGLTLGLFFSPQSRLFNAPQPFDPVTLSTAPNDRQSVPITSTEPESIISDYLDAANHGVQIDLQSYAQGRYERTNPLGWRKYLVSMDLYTEFAAFQAVRHLLEAERARLAGTASTTSQGGEPSPNVSDRPTPPTP